MARILLLIVLFWILYHVLKRFVASSNQASAPPPAKPVEKIVQCSQCGLHIPESESHTQNDLITCNNPNCKHLASQQNQHGD